MRFYFNRKTSNSVESSKLGKPSFKKMKKIMENSIIGRGGSAMSNSIIQKNTVYFNTRPLFEAIK